jgi:hypothetical protein
MSSQNFKNHGRYIFIYHIVTSVAILLVLIGSIITYVHSDGSLRHASIMLILISLILGSLFWYSRVFALKAQDRAIRSEENLRHFILTGKPLDSRLRISQIIALRFASDEEFVDLAKRSAEENLGQKEIKKAINNWKADHHRV